MSVPRQGLTPLTGALSLTQRKSDSFTVQVKPGIRYKVAYRYSDYLCAYKLEVTNWDGMVRTWMLTDLPDVRMQFEQCVKMAMREDAYNTWAAETLAGK